MRMKGFTCNYVVDILDKKFFLFFLPSPLEGKEKKKSIAHSATYMKTMRQVSKGGQCPGVPICQWA
jgi:hypothetical protein